MTFFGRPVIFLPGDNERDTSRRRQTTGIPRRNSRRRPYPYHLSRYPFEYIFDVDPFDDVYVEDYPEESLYDMRNPPAEYVIPEPRRVYVYKTKTDPECQKPEETMKKKKPKTETRNVQDSRKVTEPSGGDKKNQFGDPVVMDLDQLVGRLFRSLYGIEGESRRQQKWTPEKDASNRIENQLKKPASEIRYQTEQRTDIQRQPEKENRTNRGSKPDEMAVQNAEAEKAAEDATFKVSHASETRNDNNSRNLTELWRNYEGRTSLRNDEAIVLDADQLVRLLVGSLYGIDTLKSGLNTSKEAAIRREQKGSKEGSNKERPQTEPTEDSHSETVKEKTADIDNKRQEVERGTEGNEEISKDTMSTEQNIVTRQEDDRTIDEPERTEGGDVEAEVIVDGNNCGDPGSRDTSGIEQTHEETTTKCALEDGCEEVPDVNCDPEEMTQLDNNDMDNRVSKKKLNEIEDGQICEYCVDDDVLCGSGGMSQTNEKQETTVQECEPGDACQMSADLDSCPEEMTPMDSNDLENSSNDVEDDVDCGCPVDVARMDGHRRMSQTDEIRGDTAETECETQDVRQNVTDRDSSPQEMSPVDNRDMEKSSAKSSLNEGADTKPSSDEVDAPLDSKYLEKNLSEVFEDPDKFQMSFDLSSFLPEEIRANLLDDRLILDAVHEVVKEGLIEKHSVQRVITLPPGVDPDSLRCRLGQDGHMAISANYVEKRKSKIITIEKHTT